MFKSGSIYTKIFGLVVIAASFCAGFFLYTDNKKDLTTTEYLNSNIEIDGYHTGTLMDPLFFNDAIDRAHDFGDRPESRVWILPHHLVPKELIAGLLRSQAKVKSPKTIVVIGPDHLGVASAPFVTSFLPWKTPYGTTTADKEYINEIVRAGVVVDSKAFDEEHSVSALVPFIHAYFPEAKIVPLLIREDVDIETRYRVADILADDMVVAIASVDFSHYLPSDVAEFHDLKSRRVIESRDYSSLSDLEIDSPASLAFAFDFAEQTASEEFDFYFREDSDAFFGYPVYETTSYILGGFTHVEQHADPVVTTMFVGDIMFTRDGSALSEDPLEYISGLENRFFRGVDLIIGNLEGSFSVEREPKKNFDFAFPKEYAGVLRKHNFDAVSLANNHSLDQGDVGYEDTLNVLETIGVGYFGHQEEELANTFTKKVGELNVTTIGVNLIEQDVDMESIKDSVMQAARNSDLQIVMVHWGEEFATTPNDEQIEWGRRLVDWGADAVIGAHPHEFQGMEVYKNVPILWSLGNFIFDQDTPEQPQYGVVAGLSFSSGTTSVQIFPIEIINHKPILATSTKSQLRDEFFSRSVLDPNLQPEGEDDIVNLLRN